MVQSYTSHEPKVEKTSAVSVSECSCVGQFGCLDAGCYCYFRCWMLYLQSTIVLVTLLEIFWGWLDDVRKTERLDPYMGPFKNDVTGLGGEEVSQVVDNL